MSGICSITAEFDCKTVEVLLPQPPSITIIPQPIIKVEVSTGIKGDKGDTGNPGSFSIPAGIENFFDDLYPSNFTEVIKDISGKPIEVNKWDSPSKTTKVFSKVITRSSGKITQVVTKNELVGSYITKTINYDLSGKVTSIQRTYTP